MRSCENKGVWENLLPQMIEIPIDEDEELTAWNEHDWSAQDWNRWWSRWSGHGWFSDAWKFS